MSDSSTSILPFTGERFMPEVTGAIWYEHWHRYCAVQRYAKGLSVLDAACGEGYGSYLLAQTAREVIGVDIAPEAIAHAKSRYAAPNLRFEVGSCTALPLPSGSVDLVVSFETIEHLWEQAEMLAEFRRVLAPGGALVISSPNLPVYSEHGAHVNDFHVKELTRDELARLLGPVFPQQRWYAQRVVAHSALWAEGADRAAARKSELLSLSEEGVRLETEPGAPMYFVVVCGAEDARLPALPALSLFDDGRQSLYGDYTRALLREKQLAWEEIDARRTAEDRLAELIKATNDLASEREKSATLADRVEALEEAYREQAATTSQRLKSLETAYDASRAELTAEREYSTSLMWEERNARGVAEGRLSELITAVNDLSSEREKSASLAARVSSLETALTTAQQRNAELVWDERNWCKIAEERLAQLNATVADLQSERERANALMWEERNSRNVAEERLTQIVAARARTEALEATVATMQAELTQTRAALAHAHADIQRWSAAVMEAQSRQMLAENALAQAREDLVQRSRALTESQSRLAYRETLVGWLRYPLARLRTRVRGSA